MNCYDWWVPASISVVAEEPSAGPREELHERLRDTVQGLSLGDRFELLYRLGLYHTDSAPGPAATPDETAALREALPKVDLILCRDLLIHLSLIDCRAALRTMALWEIAAIEQKIRSSAE